MLAECLLTSNIQNVGLCDVEGREGSAHWKVHRLTAQEKRSAKIPPGHPATPTHSFILNGLHCWPTSSSHLWLDVNITCNITSALGISIRSLRVINAAGLGGHVFAPPQDVQSPQ